VRVLVTGAASGIGRATCLRLARDARAAGRKAQIAAVDLGPSPALDGLVRELGDLGAAALPLAGDMATADAPARVVDEAIARFGEAVKPEPRPVPDEQARALGELVARRRQIVEMMVAERNRRRQLTHRRVVKGLERHLAALQKELTEIEREIGDSIRGTPAWRENEDLLTGVQGVAGITAFTIIPSAIAASAVAEPIELPKTTTALGLWVMRSQSTTASRSPRSRTPSVVSVPPL